MDRRYKKSVRKNRVNAPIALITKVTRRFSQYTLRPGRSSTMTKRSMIWSAALVTAGLAVSAASQDAPWRIAQAAAQTAPAALSEPQEVNGASGVVAEIVQCKRGDGVLSI